MLQCIALVRKWFKMFFGKKKEQVKATDKLLLLLQNDTYDVNSVTSCYINAIHEIIASTNDYDAVEVKKKELYNKIYGSRHGIEWFTQSCIAYFESIKDKEEIEAIAEQCDIYLSLYWFFYEYDPEGISVLKQRMDELVSPALRRFYEKNFNIDVYTGMVLDEEVEEENAYKHHFYKASFAYNQGKGDLELSIREWRTFLNELYFILGSRPRVVFDFAREVVEHQKLFMFLVYAMKIEKMDRIRNSAMHAEGTPLRMVLSKVVNAVYAIDEEYGMLLKRYYA